MFFDGAAYLIPSGEPADDPQSPFPACQEKKREEGRPLAVDEEWKQSGTV